MGSQYIILWDRVFFSKPNTLKTTHVVAYYPQFTHSHLLLSTMSLYECFLLLVQPQTQLKTRQIYFTFLKVRNKKWDHWAKFKLLTSIGKKDCFPFRLFQEESVPLPFLASHSRLHSSIPGPPMVTSKASNIRQSFSHHHVSGPTVTSSPLISTLCLFIQPVKSLLIIFGPPE